MTPSTVTDVSATFVASTTLRAGDFWKRTVLLFGREVAMERPDFQVRCGCEIGEFVGGLTDFAQTGQKREDVAIGTVDRFADPCRDRFVNGRIGPPRPIDQLDGEGEAAALHDRTATKKRGDRAGFHGRGHDDRL